MSRKKDYIVKPNARDERLCNVLKHTQHVSTEQARSLVSSHRIDNYIKQGVIKKVHYLSNQKQGTAYELTAKGRKWIEKNFTHLRGNFYTTSSASVRHNIRLAEQAIEQTRQGRELLTERDLKEYLLQRIQAIEDIQERFNLTRQYENRKISVPDMAYVREDGVLECVEVINENYTAQVLQQKANFELATGISIHYIKQ